MKPPAFRCAGPSRRQERGVTMVLVAIAMVAILAMAALSIDVVTLYLAKEEAQRSADAAALAAARVISLSGIMGDVSNVVPSYWQAICGGPTSAATQTAQTVATQNAIGGAVGAVSVTYSAAGASNPDCSTFLPDGAFGVNPMVTVKIIQSSLPTFFSRIWGNTGNTVSASATAEAFNPSGSFVVGNQVSGVITPVQPRCVKPWMVPNLDPRNPNTSCNATTCNAFVDPGDGRIVYAGISTGGGSSNGVIGERFLLIPDCQRHTTGSCLPRAGGIQANHLTNGSYVPTIPNLEYLPGQTLNTPVAIPSAAARSPYEQAIAGCDTTVYYCGVSSASPVGSGPNMVDLSENPWFTGDTAAGVAALINEGNVNTNAQPSGQDTLNPYGSPAAYPFQILAGSSNPLLGTGLTANTQITASNSIVSLPIYDTPNLINPIGTSPVTIVGFLQVFINSADQYGNVDVTVLNVAGCGNGRNLPGTAVTGSSPVPIRLITPP